MSEAFVRQTRGQSSGSEIAWIHPSLRDLTIEQLSENSGDRIRFLSLCDEAGIKLATSVGGGPKGGRDLPLLRGQKDWEILKTRSIELTNQEVDVLDVLWRNLRVLEDKAKKAGVNLDTASTLRRLIVEDILPATAKALEQPRQMFGLGMIMNFFEIRESLGAKVVLDLSNPWALCIRETAKGWDEDEPILEHTFGLVYFVEFVKAIETNDPTFLESAAAKTSFDDVIRLMSDRGDTERRAINFGDRDRDDLQEVVEGYHTLSKYFAE